MLRPRGERRKGSEIIAFVAAVAAALSCSLHFPGTSGTPLGTIDASEMTGSSTKTRKSYLRPALAAAALSAAVLLTGCDSFTQVYQRGYVLPEGALEQIRLGASQEQVLIVLGTPSTVATVSGEVFYYISQRAEQKLAFLQQQVTNQRVVAVYFDRQRRVERLANYGLRDGRVFDFVSRTTPTSGQELNYLNYIFSITKPIGS